MPMKHSADKELSDNDLKIMAQRAKRFLGAHDNLKRSVEFTLHQKLKIQVDAIKRTRR